MGRQRRRKRHGQGTGYRLSRPRYGVSGLETALTRMPTLTRPLTLSIIGDADRRAWGSRPGAATGGTKQTPARISTAHCGSRWARRWRREREWGTSSTWSPTAHHRSAALLRSIVLFVVVAVLFLRLLFFFDCCCGRGRSDDQARATSVSTGLIRYQEKKGHQPS